MDIAPRIIAGAVAAGLGATLIMDLWNLFLKWSFGVPSLNMCLLGRWLRHMLRGTFVHATIGAAPRARFECAAGGIAHYTIGAVLAVAFVGLVSDGWPSRPTFLPALLYGIGTVIFPYFIMQPALGLGVASSRTPKPAQARVKSLMSHAVFGVGLYVCSPILSYLLKAQTS